MSEPYSIEVFRRGDQMFVGYTIPSEVADLDQGEAWTATAEISSLAAVLREAERAAQKKIAEVPRSERKGVGMWTALGFRSWNQFVRGATLCSISILEGESTHITYAIRDPKTNSLSGNNPQPRVNCLPGASMEQIARVVLDIFAHNPPPEAPPGPARKGRARGA